MSTDQTTTGICANEVCYYNRINVAIPLFGGLCKGCSKVRSIGKKATEKPKPESIKQAAINRAYNLDVAVWKKEHHECMAKLTGCTKKTDDCHHKKGRGTNQMDQSTWLPVCRTCHDLIELNPTFAKALGLSTSRLAKNEEEA